MMDWNGEEIARLLLLVHGLTYELDATARESMLFTILVKLSVYLPGVVAATDAALARQLDIIRKTGGAR